MNDENLIPLNRRTTDEAREIRRQGGKASGEARRRKKELRDTLQMLIDYDASQAVTNKERSRENNATNRERAKNEPRKTKAQKQAVQDFAESITDGISRMTPHPKNSADYLAGFDMARACALELIRVCARDRTR